MSQVQRGIIFLFMNVKRFQRSFSGVVLYPIIYETKNLGSADLSIFVLGFLIRVTGYGGTFFGLVLKTIAGIV